MDLERLRVVALFFWGRSGSVFLHSLFDSHPEVLTIPATRLNAFHARQWPSIAEQPDVRAMARRFVEWNPSVFDGARDRWFEGLDALGEARDTPLWVDPEAFETELTRLLSGGAPLSRRRFFLAAHVAYALARGEDISEKTTLVYHLHSPEAYPAIEAALADFPDLRAIGITREPIKSTLSYLRKNVLVARAWGQIDRSEYAQLAPTGGLNFVYRHQLIGWRELLARHPLCFRPLRLEDLNADLEGQMRELASFVGIRWDPCLTRSTWGGLAYHGEPTAAARHDAGDARAPSAAEAEAALDGLDRYVLTGLLARARRQLGYGDTPTAQRLLSALLVLAPTRLERMALWTCLATPAAPRALHGASATLRHMLERQAFSYRHLACELWPGLRARLPLPRPLSTGLSLPRR